MRSYRHLFWLLSICVVLTCCQKENGGETGGGTDKETPQKQKEETPEISFIEDPSFAEIRSVGENIQVEVSANAEIQVTAPEWIHQVVPTSKVATSRKLTFKIDPNHSGENRTGTVTLSNKEKSISFSVSQRWKTTIPDPNFEAFLLEHFDLNKDGVLIPSEVEKIVILDAEQLDESSAKEAFITLNITSLEGIQDFFNLEELRFRNNQVTEVDLSGNPKLRRLNCKQNQIASLDLSMCPNLEGLDCSENPLTSLNVTGCPKLTEIYCRTHQLTTLDVSQNPELLYLHCNDGQLTALDVSRNRKLYHFYCYSNALTTLDISNNPTIEHFRCDKNQLTTLHIAENSRLWYFHCAENQLSSLYVKNLSNLHTLGCYQNVLETLDFDDSPTFNYLIADNNPTLREVTFGNCPDLENIILNNGALMSLDVSTLPALQTLNVSCNLLNELDLRYNVNLTALIANQNPLTKVIISSGMNPSLYTDQNVTVETVPGPATPSTLKSMIKKPDTPVIDSVRL